jgi:hypothetical protein
LRWWELGQEEFEYCWSMNQLHKNTGSILA